MSGMTPEAAELMQKYARLAIGEVTDATLKSAGSVNPLLEQIASLLLGEVLTEDMTKRMINVFERLLVDLFGDEYTTKIIAKKVIIKDNREG